MTEDERPGRNPGPVGRPTGSGGGKRGASPGRAQTRPNAAGDKRTSTPGGNPERARGGRPSSAADPSERAGRPSGGGGRPVRPVRGGSAADRPGSGGQASGGARSGGPRTRSAGASENRPTGRPAVSERTARPTGAGATRAPRADGTEGRPTDAGGRAGRPAPSGDGRPTGGERQARSARSGDGSRELRSARAQRNAGPATRLTQEQRAEIASRYDPRRERRRQEARVALPDDVEPQMLDPHVRTELRSLARDTSDLVARHLVMTGRLLDEDPAAALTHARAARAMAGRVGAVREAVGIAAYHAGEWSDALSELRAARRITGRTDQLPVLADCERALGRPEKALAYGDDPAVTKLPQDVQVELVIVLAGARLDLAQPDAAVLLLQEPAKRTLSRRPWAARLWYAFADALLAAGRENDARTWFAKVVDVDLEGETDAVDRLLELDGVVLEEPAEDADGS